MVAIGRLRLLLDAALWRIRMLLPYDGNDGAVLERALRLAENLKERKYVGIDVNASNPPREISTVPAFAMLGWLNLAELTGQQSCRDNADECSHKILGQQTKEGCWLFPYRFRSNPENFAYSCENFMTIECLMEYWERTGKPDRVLGPIEVALQYLLDNIGSEGGLFWYSAADRIRVCNISSMAARVFAEASQMLEKPEHLELARACADYCVSKQAPNGSYPYFDYDTMVAVSYHSLEIWELALASRVLQDARITTSVERAVEYLRCTIRQQGYASRDPANGSDMLFKTAIWAAKAFLTTGFVDEAWTHVNNALRWFRIPGRDDYFLEMCRHRGVRIPMLNTPFIRYNASALEICTCALLERQRARSRHER